MCQCCTSVRHSESLSPLNSEWLLPSACNQAQFLSCQGCTSVRRSESLSTLKSGWLLPTACYQAHYLSKWHLNGNLLPSVYFPLMFPKKYLSTSHALFTICFLSVYSKLCLAGCTWDETFQNMIEWVKVSLISYTDQAIFLYLFWIFQNYLTLYESYIIHFPHEKETKKFQTPNPIVTRVITKNSKQIKSG
jgi:hypothetical protein